MYSLLVEEIDVGEAKCRQVVSGLAKFCSPEQLTVCSLSLSISICYISGFFELVLLHSLGAFISSNYFMLVVVPAESPCGTRDKHETIETKGCSIRGNGIIFPSKLCLISHYIFQ